MKSVRERGALPAARSGGAAGHDARGAPARRAPTRAPGCCL